MLPRRCAASKKFFASWRGCLAATRLTCSQSKLQPKALAKNRRRRLRGKRATYRYESVGFEVARPCGKTTTIATFKDTEFSPHGQVIADPLGLLERQIVLAEKIEHTTAAGKLGCGGFVQENVVVLGVVQCIRRR